MPRKKASIAPSDSELLEELTPEEIAEYDATFGAMDRWGDLVVEAWLERRNQRFEFRTEDYYFHLLATTEGRSIAKGEVLVTRANDGFVALVSGKAYRNRFDKLQMEILESALTRRGVPQVRVRPPHGTLWVHDEDLDRWHQGASLWGRLTPRERQGRYLWIAELLVSAFLGHEERYRYNDGHCSASAYSGGYVLAHIAAGAECLVTRVATVPQIVLVCARRYPVKSHNRELRDAVRHVLDRRGVPWRDVRPASTGVSTMDALVNAWHANPLRLE